MGSTDLGSFGAVLSGGLLIFDASDFVSVQLANGKKGSPKPRVHRVILEPRRTLSEIINADPHPRPRDVIGLEAQVSFLGGKSDVSDSTPVQWLRSGRIMVDFYVRGPMKRAVCTLTKEANAQLQVWMDSLEEAGKIKS